MEEKLNCAIVNPVPGIGPETDLHIKHFELKIDQVDTKDSYLLQKIQKMQTSQNKK